MKHRLQKIETLILEKLTINVKQLLKKAVFEPFKLNKPGNLSFGDYTCEIAMTLWARNKFLCQKKYQNPRQLANALVKLLLADQELTNLVKKIEVAGPGFINFVLQDKVWLELFSHDLETIWFAKNDDRKIIVEYSSPNIAKPFSIGHLRSTVIGDALANLLQANGAEVLRDNHLGDWGTQFGKLIVAVEKWGSWQEIEQAEYPIKILFSLYVKFHQEAEQNEKLNDEARLAFKKMEEGDKKILSIWQKIIDLSMLEFNKIYSKLSVQFSENEGRGYGESWVRDDTKLIIAQLEEKKLLKKSQEALIVEFPASDKLPPLMIIKKDGSSLYATRDLATDWRRRENYDKDIVIINEVGKEQSLYFKQLYRLEELLGWFQPEQRIHVAHGLYRFKDRKMSTRKGDVIWLEDIWQEIENKVRSQSKIKLSNNDVRIMVSGAIKWYDLVREAQNDIDFDLKQMLNLKGNSGLYMQYTGVRIQSLLQKADFKAYNDLSMSEIKVLLLKERFWCLTNKLKWSQNQLRLIKKILQFSAIKEQAGFSLKTNLLANYLFVLAQDFNNFYNQNQILNHQTNLILTKAIGVVLTSGLQILGIQIPSKM